jgi:hypothetical protein
MPERIAMPVATPADMILAAVTDLKKALQMPKQGTIVPHLLPTVTEKLQELSDLMTNNDNGAGNDPRQDDPAEQPPEEPQPEPPTVATPLPIIRPKDHQPRNLRIKFATPTTFKPTSTLPHHQRHTAKFKTRLAESIARGEDYGKLQEPKNHRNFYEPLRVDEDEDEEEEEEEDENPTSPPLRVKTQKKKKKKKKGKQPKTNPPLRVEEEDESKEENDEQGSTRKQPKRTKTKPKIFDPEKGYLAVTSHQIEEACKEIETLEVETIHIPKGYAFKAINPDTGELNEYSKLAKSSDGLLWTTAMGMELGRLFQGFAPKNGKAVSGTNTCRFIKFNEVPKGKKVTYVRIVTADRPKKEEPRRVRMTVGGDQIEYPGDCATKGADLITAKCLFNSVVSTPNAKMMGMDIKDFYLNTILPNPEYVRIPISIIPEEFIEAYNLWEFVHEGYVYVEVTGGMYGLPQAGRIANDELIPRLTEGGYKETGHTPGLFKHDTNSVVFCLIVDDFGVKYEDKDDAVHLRNLLKEHYTITEDWKGENFIGLNLKWDYEKRTVDLSIKDYVKKALQRFEHQPPKRAQHAPSKWTAPQYGAQIQMTEPDDESPELDKHMIKRLQEIIGVLLYYARAVDSTMLVALGTLAATQAHGTEATMEAAVHLLNYAATHPDATLRFHASDMKLHIYSDASYLSEPKARSRVGGYFYLDGKEDPQPGKPPKLNGAIHVESRIMKNVMASAAEAETGGLFINGQEATYIRRVLEEMGHPQDGPTTIITDNSTANGFANATMKIKRSKAMDMRFYWIRDRVKQGQFKVLWQRGETNLADYFTKHHPPSHHTAMRKIYLHDKKSTVTSECEGVLNPETRLTEHPPESQPVSDSSAPSTQHCTLTHSPTLSQQTPTSLYAMHRRCSDCDSRRLANLPSFRTITRQQ